MKTINILFLLISFHCASQLRPGFYTQGSWRGFNYIEEQFNLTGAFTLHLNKLTTGLAIGAECWYVEKSLNFDPTDAMKPSFTGKIEPWFGLQSNLFHSNVFFSANLGARFYFLNQLNDSLSLKDKGTGLAISSRQAINSLPNYYPNSNTPMKAGFYYVTKMPFTILTRVNIGYEFNRIQVSAFIMPYWIRFHYENATHSDNKGETFIFFYDVGLGVNYTLPHKKEKANT